MLTFSNSHLWTACASSVHPIPGLSKPVVSKERSDLRLEGEAAGWLANLVLRGDASLAADGLGETAPNGWPIDEAMVRHVQNYIDLVSRHGQPNPEVDVALFNGQVTGRPDNHTVDSDILRIYELKYGYKIVEPYGNTQLLLGALAFVKPHHRLVSLEVYQPRASHANGPHRKWVLNQDELRLWERWFIDCIEATKVREPMATPGDQCAYCDRTAGCHALMANIQAFYEIIATNHKGRAAATHEIGAELKMLTTMKKLLDARLSGVQTEAEVRARNGEFIPLWMLDPHYGNRVWKASPAVREMMTGIDPYKQVEKSPAEMEKEGANVDALTETPFVGMKLRPWDDKKAARRFKT